MAVTAQAARRVGFINIPYAKRYERIYLAYIAGVAAHKVIPSLRA